VAEERYVIRLAGRQPPESPLRGSQGFPGIKELRARAQRSGEELIEIAEILRSTKVLRGLWRGEPYEMPAMVPMVQAINHATEHRA
jgi:hypothetical protein